MTCEVHAFDLKGLVRKLVSRSCEGANESCHTSHLASHPCGDPDGAVERRRAGSLAPTATPPTGSFVCDLLHDQAGAGFGCEVHHQTRRGGEHGSWQATRAIPGNAARWKVGAE
jgi:hypothetical protein